VDVDEEARIAKRKGKVVHIVVGDVEGVELGVVYCQPGFLDGDDRRIQAFDSELEVVELVDD
jgi:hypothetical protein